MFINNFDPVAIQIFSIEIRWYSLAYIFGILLGWLYCKKLLIQDKNTSKLFDDLISYLIIGIILGGRLGYVIFYNAEYYLNNFFEILMIWQGGMSFHGGLVGVIVATIIFCKKHNTNKFVFLESGSGAQNHTTSEIVNILANLLTVPIIVGGGINSAESAKHLASSGADYIVTGTQLETEPSIENLLKFTEAVHLS